MANGLRGLASLGPLRKYVHSLKPANKSRYISLQELRPTSKASSSGSQRHRNDVGDCQDDELNNFKTNIISKSLSMDLLAMFDLLKRYQLSNSINFLVD